VLAAFGAASDTFLTTVAGVTDWEAPGLGEWTVRELVAHTLRAYTTIETYLDAEVTNDPVLPNAVEYYRAVVGVPGVHAGVAARGREAARALTDPLTQATAIAARVLPRARETPGDRLTQSIAGPIAFTEYLATRTVELCVHTLDLQAALGLPKTMPGEVVELCLDALQPLADPVELLLAIAGRVRINVLG
jgi:uncharacterized protein (TIGR03083 family)